MVCNNWVKKYAAKPNTMPARATLDSNKKSNRTKES
jgi:hypothetical protein